MPINRYITTFFNNVTTYNAMVAQDRQLHRDTQLLHFKNYIYRVCDLDSLTHHLNIISLTTPIDPEDKLWYYRHMAHRIDLDDKLRHSDQRYWDTVSDHGRNSILSDTDSIHTSDTYSTHTLQVH